MCAIALSLAYPVREYIDQRRAVAALRQQEQQYQKQVNDLARAKQRLSDKSYIEREAVRRLNFCMPNYKCYVVLDGGGSNGTQAPQSGSRRTPPWYETLWQSVETADKRR
jgi:hypothetical protein